MHRFTRAGKWDGEKKRNPRGVSRSNEEESGMTLFSCSFPIHTLPPGLSLRILLMPAQPLRISLVSHGFGAPWNCNPNIDKDRKSTSLKMGRRPGRSVYRVAPAKEKPHSKHWDENRPPLARPNWDILDRCCYYGHKRVPCSARLYLEVKDKIISFAPWSYWSSRLRFLAPSTNWMDYYQENSATEKSNVTMENRIQHCNQVLKSFPLKSLQTNWTSVGTIKPHS